MEHDHAPTTFQFFQSLDSNRSGVLTKDELIAVFAEHDLELSAEELASLLTDLGCAGTDTDVHLVDFMDAFQRARQQIAGAQTPRVGVAPTGVPRLDLFSLRRREAGTWPPVLERVLAAMEAQHMQLFAFFQALDTDNSGAVSIGELRAAFVRFGVTVNAYELKELLTALDQDGDGEVELVEFMDAVHEALISRAAHQDLVGQVLPTPAAADSSHTLDAPRARADKLMTAEPEMQHIGVLSGANEGAAAVCCADIRAYTQGLRLWKVFGRTRFPVFLGLLCSLTLPMLDVATDWAVTWSFYIAGDLNWFKTRLTIQLLSGALSGILLAAIDFHEKLGKLPLTLRLEYYQMQSHVLSSAIPLTGVALRWVAQE